MPDTDLTPGFFGKLPSTGDFVSRGLPPAFVAGWDRWLARHVVHRLTPASPPLYFRWPGPAACTGVVLPSHDSAGRRFPITLAAEDSSPGFDEASQIAEGPCKVCPPLATFLDEIALLGHEAVSRRLAPDALAACLAAVAVPLGARSTRFLLWTDHADVRAADPDAPGPVLDTLLAAPAETG